MLLLARVSAATSAAAACADATASCQTSYLAPAICLGSPPAASSSNPTESDPSGARQLKLLRRFGVFKVTFADSRDGDDPDGKDSKEDVEVELPVISDTTHTHG